MCKCTPYMRTPFCGAPGCEWPKPEFTDWQPAETAPKDGSHIIACRGPYSEHWGFDQSPPFVVHYFEDGFYLSHGIVADSYNDVPQQFTHWRKFEPPRGAI